MVLSTEKILHKYYTSGYVVCGTNIRADSETYQIFFGSNPSLYPSTFIQKMLFSNRTLLWYLTKYTYPIFLHLFI